MPDSGRNVYAPQATIGRLLAQPVTGLDSAVIVEQDHVGKALQYEERFGFRRVAMAMRTDICSLQQDVEKAVRVVRHAGMEIMIHAQARRFRGKRGHLIEKSAGDWLHFSHGFKDSQNVI